MLQIACFRYCDPGLDEDELNKLNPSILDKLWVEGKTMPNSTVMNGIFTLRCAVTNHRTKYQDLCFIDEVAELGKRLSKP